jgi:hypothetical protein
MIPFQVQLERFLLGFPTISDFMQWAWSWPLVESVHFTGLTLLFGSIAAWDLRLLGFAKHVPLSDFHRLIPFAIVGFAINAVSGTFFLMTYPDQYIYNPAFHLKMLCVLLAGANAATFYLHARPWIARLNGAVSIALWVTVIVCGRMITFFRPSGCRPGEAIGLLAECIVR